MPSSLWGRLMLTPETTALCARFWTKSAKAFRTAGSEHQLPSRPPPKSYAAQSGFASRYGIDLGQQAGMDALQPFLSDERCRVSRAVAPRKQSYSDRTGVSRRDKIGDAPPEAVEQHRRKPGRRSAPGISSRYLPSALRGKRSRHRLHGGL